MATIDEIIGKEALDRVVKVTESLGQAVTNIENLYNASKKLNSELGKQSGGSGGNSAKKQQELNAATQESIRINKELEKTQAKLALVESEQNKELIKAKQSYAEKNKAQQESIKANQLEAGSLAALKAENKELIKQRDSINASTDIGRQKIAELNKQIDKNNETIKANSSNLEKQKINVGNYKSGITGLWDAFKAGEIGISGLIKGFGKMTLALATNPLFLVIAALVGIFKTLYDAFAQTASGGLILKKAFAVVGAIFDTIKIKVVEFIGAFGKILSGDFSEGFKDLGKSIASTGDDFARAANAAAKLVDETAKLNRQITFEISADAEVENRMAKLLFLSKDQTKSTIERRKALEEYLKLAREEADESVEFARRDLSNALNADAVKAKITRAELERFIKLDKDTQLLELERNKRIAFAFNVLGEKEIESLEEKYAAFIKADTEYFETNKRTQSQLTGFIEEERKKQQEAAKKAAEERKKQEEKAKEEREKSLKEDTDFVERELELQTDATNQRYLEETKIAAEFLELRAQKELDAQIAFQMQKRMAGEISEKEYADAVEKIVFESEKKKYAAVIERMELEATLFDEGTAERLEIEKKLADAKKNLNELEYNAFAESEEKKTEKTKEEAEKRKAAIEKIKDTAIQFANELFELEKTLLDRKISDLEAAKQYELELAGTNEQQREAIEKKYSSKIAAERLKQAKVEKAQALFNIAISTAQGVVAALAVAPPIGFILAALVGALGATQAGIVAAKPLPKFEKGTMNAPGGLATVSEKGFELMEHNGNLSLTPPTESIINVPKGAKIYPHTKTLQMLTQNDKDVNDVLLLRIEKAIKEGNSSENRTAYDTIIKKQNQTVRRIDKYFR